MKTTASLIFALAAFATAAQAETTANTTSANDMNLPLSQLYPGAVKDASASSTKSREQVTEEFQRSRLAGTSAQYSAMGGYQLKMSFPGIVAEPKVAGKTRTEVQAEYQASRLNNSPAAYSSLDSYQLSQAFPGAVAQDKAVATSANQIAGQASNAKLQ